MKKLAKRLAAVLMAAVMTVGISMTAFAADPTVEATGTLKVTGSGLWLPADSEGKSVTAIRMFTARVTDGTGENTFDSYVLDPEWKGFFTDNTRFAAVKLAGGISEDTTAEAISEVDLSNAAVAYVKTLQTQDSDQMPTFAHKAQVWARAHSGSFTLLTKTEMAESASDKSDATKGTATFQDLTAGYYLVYPEGGSTGNNNRGTDAILANVPEKSGTTEVNIKSTYPTVDKKVSTENNDTYATNGTAQVGDQVTFQLHSKVPDMTDYKTYTFTFNDTLSNGLAFDAGSVKVSIGGTPISSGYDVTAPTTDNHHTLTVKFNDLKTVNDSTTGADIVVTYTAHITAAATTANPADNTVTVSYSDDPSTDSQGTSQPSESKVYTYQIDIDKYTGTYSDNAERLAGATFQLKNSNATGATPIDLVAEANAEDGSLVYHIKGTDETTATVVTDVTTPENGKITIKGLKAGTYYLYETTAPSGYNKLTKPVTVVITADDADLTNFTYTINDKASAAKDATVPVQNNKGQMLPTTGSMGTIGLVALGVAVVLIGVFMPRKKKANR